MAKSVVSFESADGKKFTTELEADAYDHALKMEVDILRFIALTSLGAAEGTRARKYISGFAAMKATELPIASE